MVLRGFVTIWSLATPPTRKAPFSESATTLGSTRLPLSVGTTLGMRLRTCATQVFVVPRSMPRMGFSRAGEPGIPWFYHASSPSPNSSGAGGHVDLDLAAHDGAIAVGSREHVRRPPRHREREAVRRVRHAQLQLPARPHRELDLDRSACR